MKMGLEGIAPNSKEKIRIFASNFKFKILLKISNFCYEMEINFQEISIEISSGANAEL